MNIGVARLIAVIAATLTLAPVSAFAAPGGGSGSTPPLPPVVPSTKQLPLHGRIPGHANGYVAIRVKLATWPNSLTDLIPSVLLFQETQTVMVTNEEFTAWVGSATAGGISPSLIADRANLGFTYALDSTPESVIGSQPVSSVAFAMSLVPGAATHASSSGPVVELSNKSGPALSATTTGTSASAAMFEIRCATNTRPAVSGTSNGSTGRGVSGVSSASSGASYGVEGRSASIAGAGGLFVNEGGGDLLIARNTIDGGPNFRVDNQGRIIVNGVQIGLIGPQGPKGAVGPPGQPGPQGPSGGGSKATFCLQVQGSTCLGKCTGGATLVGATVSPCAVTSSAGACAWAGVDGSCCVCAK